MFDISLNRTSSTCNLSFLFLCDDVMKYYPTFRINFFLLFFCASYRIFNQAFSLYYIIVYFSRYSFFFPFFFFSFHFVTRIARIPDSKRKFMFSFVVHENVFRASVFKSYSKVEEETNS